MNTNISVLIVDDHKYFRDGVEMALGKIKGVAKIMTASGGSGALAALEKNSADVVLMDIHMPDGMNGYEATRQITERYPEIKVIGFSVFDKTVNIERMHRAGAVGFMSKNDDTDEFEIAFEKVLGGHYFFSAKLVDDALDALRHIETSGKHNKLSDETRALRKAIVSGLCRGEKEKEIADKNSKSVADIKYHKQKMFSEFGVSNTPELISFLSRNGIDDLLY